MLMYLKALGKEDGSLSDELYSNKVLDSWNDINFLIFFLYCDYSIPSPELHTA